MPTYEYRCTKCGHQFELFHGIKDERPKRCPRCRGRARRVPAGGAGLIFKGSGFYITDYRSDSYREKAKAEQGSGSGPASGGGGSGAGSTGGGGTGSKSEAKPARKSPGRSGGEKTPPSC